jgi:hypothetical protein
VKDTKINKNINPSCPSDLSSCPSWIPDPSEWCYQVVADELYHLLRRLDCWGNGQFNPAVPAARGVVCDNPRREFPMAKIVGRKALRMEAQSGRFFLGFKTTASGSY